MLSLILTTIFFLTSSPTLSQLIFLEQTVKSDFYLEMKFPYSLGPKITAEAATIVDLDSNKTCFIKGESKIHSIASLTKLMTALVFLENNNLNWENKVLIKKEDLIVNSDSPKDIEPAELNLKPGQEVRLKDVFSAGLIKSANDAMKILSRLASLPEGKKFIDLMNEKARVLGMNNTHFVEPTGLSPENYSTVEDLVKLATMAFAKQEIKDALNKKSYDFIIFEKGKRVNVQRVLNTNKLLGSFIGIDKAKTGYLEESGYCLAGVSDFQNKRLAVIILGSKSDEDRFQEAKSLIWWAINNCQNSVKW